MRPRIPDRRAIKHADAIDVIVAEVLRRLSAGDVVSFETIIQQNPLLMPELGARLDDIARIEHAAATVSKEPSHGDERASASEPFCHDLSLLRQELKDYDIHERIHHGGQGVVYRATQISTCRPVALKVLLHGAFASERQRIRFQREVELISRLRHPNIVTLFESGVVQGRHYYAMEFIEGVPIDDFVLWHNLSLQDRIKQVIVVSRTVAEAHKRGIIHRDLKPSNILVDGAGSPRILDFGLAKDTLDSNPNDFSREGQVIGTLPYLSPEQVVAHVGGVDTRTDVYALGVTLYVLITGQFPYSVAGGPLAVRDSIVRGEPMTLRKALADAPRNSIRVEEINEDLEAIIATVLAKQPGLRYQSADDFANDLQRLLIGEAVQARAANRRYLVLKTLRRYRLVTALAVGLLIAVGVIATVIVRLVVQGRVATATGEARTLAERLENVSLLNALQAKESYARLLQDLAAEPNHVWSGEAKRLLNRRPAPSIESWSWTSTMPRDLIHLVRVHDMAGRETARRWLATAQVELDRLCSTLGESSLAFDTATLGGFTNNPETGAVRSASLGCSAFLARAYLRFDDGQPDRALADAVAAYRLATDVGDGVSLRHKTTAQSQLTELLRLIQYALGQMQASGVIDSQWTDWILQIRDVGGPQSALPYLSLSVMQSVNAACRIDQNHARRYIDLDELDQLMGGLFSSVDALTDEHRRLVRQMNPGDIRAWSDRFIWSTASMSTLPLDQLLDRLGDDARALEQARSDNPITLMFPWLGQAYKSHLITRATLSGLRVTARVLSHRARVGMWPEGLADADVSGINWIDPLTGASFVFELHDAVPFVMSEKLRSEAFGGSSSDAPSGHACWFWSARGCMVYFPSEPTESTRE